MNGMISEAKGGIDELRAAPAPALGIAASHVPSPERTPVPDFDLVIFGGTGDLALRKLLPAMLAREGEGVLPETGRILCIGRRALSQESLVGQVTAELRGAAPDGASLERFLKRLSYLQLDATDRARFAELHALLRPGVTRVFYLSTAPSLYEPIAEHLHAQGLVTAGSRIVLEKPIGRDLTSARRINDSVGRVFPETGIFRIDHYLGKETVQNLLILRFANRIFERLWNSTDIDHVQITCAETLGLEGRASYYDTAGALRDMVQNHLIQLLCLFAMEPPSRLDAESVRDEKVKVIRSLRPFSGEAVREATVRGQYTAGAIAGIPVPGYLTELGRPEGSRTETFVALRTEIANWRWSGVPIYIRTGKRLAAKSTEITVIFKAVPHQIFEGQHGHIARNALTIRVQPDEGLSLLAMSKVPGSGRLRLLPAALDLSFEHAFRGRTPDAYERLLTDVIRGDPTLFMRRDEVEAAWSWIDGISEAWDQHYPVPERYAAGTWGPSSAIALIARDGRSWVQHET